MEFLQSGSCVCVQSLALTCLVLPSYCCITWPLSSSSRWFVVVSISLSESSLPYSYPLPSLHVCQTLYKCRIVLSSRSCAVYAVSPCLTRTVRGGKNALECVSFPRASCPSVEMSACFVVIAAIAQCVIGGYYYISSKCDELVGLLQSHAQFYEPRVLNFCNTFQYSPLNLFLCITKFTQIFQGSNILILKYVYLRHDTCVCVCMPPDTTNVLTKQQEAAIFLDESKMCDNIMKYCSDSISILIVCGNENYVGEKDYSHQSNIFCSPLLTVILLRLLFFF